MKGATNLLSWRSVLKMPKRLRPTSKKSKRGKRGNVRSRSSVTSLRNGKQKGGSTLSKSENASNPTPQSAATACSTRGRKYGGVALSRVVIEEQCPCGKSMEVCNAEWESLLNVLEPTAENYKENLKTLHGVEAEGGDPYHWRARIGLKTMQR